MKKALVLAMLASPAAAQQDEGPKCYPIQMVQAGEAGVGRHVIFSGLTGARDAIVQIYAGQNGTWVLFTVTPNGVACLISGGEWHEQPQAEPAGEDS